MSFGDGSLKIQLPLRWQILKANNMKALIDLHAPPGGGSRCAS